MQGRCALLLAALSPPLFCITTYHAMRYKGGVCQVFQVFRFSKYPLQSGKLHFSSMLDKYVRYSGELPHVPLRCMWGYQIAIPYQEFYRFLSRVSRFFTIRGPTYSLNEGSGRRQYVERRNGGTWNVKDDLEEGR